MELTSGAHVLAWLGRDLGNELLFFEAKGEQCPHMAAAIRQVLPGHTVTRTDICEDFDAPDAFEQLMDTARKSKPGRVCSQYERLPDDPSEGRTWSCGKRAGNGYLRIYEKGKQPEYRLGGCPNWVRVEFEIKPHYRQERQAAACMTPDQILGIVPWCATVASELLGRSIPKRIRPPRSQSENQTTHYLARTFRRHWVDRLGEGRDWNSIGAEFEEIWALDDELRKREGKFT